MAALSPINYRQQYARYKRYFRELTQTYAQKPGVRTSIELLLSLLVISFFAIFALRPTLNTIAELWATIRSQREAGQQLDQKLQALATAQTVWSRDQERLSLLEEALPSEAQPEKFLRQIEGLAAEHNVSINSFNIDEVLLFGEELKKKREKKEKEGIEGAQEFTLSFSVGADFEPLMAFLTGLENLRNVIEIEAFAFGRSSGKQTGPLSLNIAGKVYFAEEGK